MGLLELEGEPVRLDMTEESKKALHHLEPRTCLRLEDLVNAAPSEVDAQRRRQAEQAERKRLAAERARLYVAERAQAKRLADEGSAPPGVRRMLEDRRLESIIAMRRWQQKAAWREQNNPPPKSFQG